MIEKKGDFYVKKMNQENSDKNLLEVERKQQEINDETPKFQGHGDENKIPETNDPQEPKEEGGLLNTRLIALFVVGFLIGITLKTHAVKSITMGFEDYKLSRFSNDFNFEQSAEIENQEVQNGDEELEMQPNEQSDGIQGDK